MSRTPAAATAIIVFVLAWTVAVVVIADRLGPVHWTVQAVYFITAGTVWVLPVRWLMLWGARQR